MTRRMVVTVCLRERGVVVLPGERRAPPERLDAQALADRLATIVARRGLGDRVEIQWGCAGGCASAGPNVSVAFYPIPRPGERPDRIAVGWKTYVGSLGTLPSVAAIIDENLTPPAGPATGGLTRPARRRSGAATRSATPRTGVRPRR